jgi:hypothetical protein
MALQPGSGLGLPLRVFVMVRCVQCGVVSPTINLVLVILIRPPETSVSKASRHLVAKQMKHGRFPSEGRRAADFITLKIHRPRPGLNPRTLGSVASTLTTRPPRATLLLFSVE